jgi:cellobiose-specific phosphotransferase system component IIC
MTTKGDWNALILIALNVAVAFVLWTPFWASFERTVRGHPEAEEELVRTAEAIREHERAEHAASSPRKHSA